MPILAQQDPPAANLRWLRLRSGLLGTVYQDGVKTNCCVNLLCVAIARSPAHKT